MLDDALGTHAVAFTDEKDEHPIVAAKAGIANRRTWDDNKGETWQDAQQRRMQNDQNKAADEAADASKTKFQIAKAKALAAANNNLFGKRNQGNDVDGFSAKMADRDERKVKAGRAKEVAATKYYSGKDSTEQNKKFKLRRESSVMMMKEQYAAMPMDEIVDQIQNKIWQRSHSDKDVVRKLMQLLRKSDLTGTGSIGPAEFHYVVRKFFGFDLSPRQTDTLFKSINKSGSGELGLVEFVQALSGHGMGTFQNHEENEDGTRGRADTMIEHGSMLDHLIDDSKDEHLRVDDHRKDEERFQLAPLSPEMIAQQVLDTIAQKQWERCHSDHDVVRQMVRQIRHWDINTDGDISEEECRAIISQYFGFDLTPAQSKAFFALLDVNGDGKISKMEFIRGLSSGDLGEKFSDPVYEARPTIDHQIRSIAENEKARAFQGAPNKEFQWEGEVMADDADIFSRRITDDAAKKVNAYKERMAKNHQRNTQKPYTKNPAKILEMIKEKIWQRSHSDHDVVRKCVWAMRLADESGEGNISEDEFANYIQKFFGFHLDSEQSKLLFCHLDADGSGEITRREFICGLSGRGTILSEDQSEIRRKATRARALNLQNAQDPNGVAQDDFATISNMGSRRTKQDRTKINALKEEQSLRAANEDFKELEGAYTHETKAIIDTMRDQIRARCKTDRELTLRVTRAMRHQDSNDNGTINVDELQQMLADEFNYVITEDAVVELMDALTGGTGEDEITKQQLVSILTNHCGHGITTANAYYADKENGGDSNGRPSSATSATSAASTATTMDYPEGFLAGRYEDGRFPYAKEDPGRPASARNRQKNAPHQEPPKRIRTTSGLKEILTQLREKVQFICGSDRAVALHVTRNFRKYDADGDGLLQAADLRHMLRDEFGFDLDMEQIRQLFDDIDQAGKGTVTKEEFVKVITGKKGHGRKPLPLLPNFSNTKGNQSRNQQQPTDAATD
jgi:Ca2+-binding EF-hand superfamily protein